MPHSIYVVALRIYCLSSFSLFAIVRFRKYLKQQQYVRNDKGNGTSTDDDDDDSAIKARTHRVMNMYGYNLWYLIHEQEEKKYFAF